MNTILLRSILQESFLTPTRHLGQGSQKVNDHSNRESGHFWRTTAPLLHQQESRTERGGGCTEKWSRPPLQKCTGSFEIKDEEAEVRRLVILLSHGSTNLGALTVQILGGTPRIFLRGRCGSFFTFAESRAPPFETGISAVENITTSSRRVATSGT